MKNHLVWLRNDLRITDNKALHASCDDEEARVYAIFIATPKQWLKHNMAPCQAMFIYENLLKVKQSLLECGIPLIYYQCDDFDASIKWLYNFCNKKNIDKIFYNRQYEINECRRDKKLEQYLNNKIICKSFDDSVIIPPGDILNNKSQMYKIYTPFRKAFIKKILTLKVDTLPSPKIRKNKIFIKNIIPYFNYPIQMIDKNYPVGEKIAFQRLLLFCQNKVQYYIENRNKIDMISTSCLSPYLSIGVLSPRQFFNVLNKEHPNFLEKPNSNAFCWFNELIWREFYRHLIVFYPFLCMNKPLINWTKNILWNKNQKNLQNWKHGLTGYPIIDAAMRQLKKTGWMHNRMRMITASFLTKNLLIDWRIGEKYFISRLLDGDLASNNGNWQWIASTGADSVPYFRTLNPISQGEKFDPKGIFIRKWIPELKYITDNYIHNPSYLFKKDKDKINYPSPIVDYKISKQQALTAFIKAKNTYLKDN